MIPVLGAGLSIFAGGLAGSCSIANVVAKNWNTAIEKEDLKMESTNNFDADQITIEMNSIELAV